MAPQDQLGYNPRGVFYLHLYGRGEKLNGGHSSSILGNAWKTFKRTLEKVLIKEFPWLRISDEVFARTLPSHVLSFDVYVAEYVAFSSIRLHLNI